VLQRHQALLAPALGGIAADAAIAEELAVHAEDRLAAQRTVAAHAIGVDALDLEIVEGQPRIESRAVRRPAGGVGTDRRPVPARPADHRVAHRPVFLVARGVHHAVLGVGLPVEVRGKLDQAAEALLALAQRLVGGDAFADVARDGGDDPGVARAQHLPARLERQLRAILAAVVAAQARGMRRVGDLAVVRLLQLLARHGQQVPGPHRQQLPARVAGELADGVVAIDEAHGRAVDQHDHVGRVVEREAETLLALLLRALGAPLRGHVARDAEHQPLAARLVAQRHGARLQPGARALEAEHLEFQAALLPEVGNPLDERPEGVAMLRGDQREDAMAAHRVEAVGLDHAQPRGVHLDQIAVAVEELHAFRLGVDDRLQPGLAAPQRAHRVGLHRSEPHQALERPPVELPLVHEVIGAAGDHRLAQAGVVVAGEDDDQRVRPLHRVQRREALRVGQVQVDDQQVVGAAGEVRARLGQRGRDVEPQLETAHAAQVLGDDLRAGPLVLEQQDADSAGQLGGARRQKHAFLPVGGYRAFNSRERLPAPAVRKIPQCRAAASTRRAPPAPGPDNA
jgi:hypothetical protein